MHKFIFIDTNVFEHFPPLSDLDWLKLAACTSATLVIPQITIRELNRHKDKSERSRQKRRAANALRDLSSWSRSPAPTTIRPSVDLIFWPNEPLIDFHSFRLSPDIPDDQLLASAIEFAKEKQLGPESVLVASADLGLEIKGRTQPSIQMLAMDETLRLADEMDPEERRTKELENRLRQLTSQIPQLSLTIDGDGKNFTERKICDGRCLSMKRR
jgi:predicted ribonuclease YlaK